MTDAAIREVHRVSSMPYGLARTQAAERVVRRLETEGPAEVVPYALGTLVDSMFWAGEAEKSFVPFTRLVRLWEEHPEHFDEHDRHALFWMFKWMVADLMEFPAVPAAQITATIEDMARRYRLEGLGLNAVMQQRFLWADELGDEATADAAFDAWCATPRDEYSQCEACEPGDRAVYLLARSRYAEVVRIVEAALAESARCATEPADMLSVLQLAHLALGNDADAARAHRRAIAELDEATGEMAGARGRLIEFCARSGNDDAALRRIVGDQQLLLQCETPRARLELLARVGTATHLVRDAGGGGRVLAMSLPGAAPTTTVAELDDWLRAEATALAAAFDARNGTTAASRLVARAWSAERDGRVVDLSVLRFSPDGDASAVAGAAVAPSGTARGDADAATPPAADTDPEADQLAQAERAVADGDPEGATAHFLAASRLAEAAGRLADAGWALANAARFAWRATDHAGATAAFARALELLDAAGTPPEHLVPVLSDHAECAADAGVPEAALPAVRAHVAALDVLLAPAPPADGPDAGSEPLAANPPDEELAGRTRAERTRARAELTDVSARLLASAGNLQGAADLAEEAAVALAELGAVADAAHAFWLAGRAHRDRGDLTAAAWHLESASEGFDIAGDRTRRAEVASELIAVLRAAGRDDEADAVRA
ncbi:hypothetical protein [Actinotalea fermentans]|uniref:Uncharacterized protein n=1 Tax=Actinotalea fermentans TaxID=43671 RepID=A0A511YVP4_9CELL|nr:hypothetical protein [Actinotalea fermentans]GEN79275.1 hypothetical protein AFE02nite_10090 [Actinotalea fermentans]